MAKNILVISPDRKSAFTLNENGAVISAIEVEKMEYSDFGDLLKAKNQSDQSKRILIPTKPEELAWLQAKSPLIFPVAELKKFTI